MNFMDFNVIDTIIIVYILINSFLGWKRGFILSIFNFFSIIGAFIIAKNFFGQFAEILIKNVKWIDTFKENITFQINNSFDSNAEVFTGIKNGTLLNKLDLPEYLNTGVNQILYNMDISNAENVSSQLAEIIVKAIVNFISFIVLFIIILLLIRIIGMLLNTLFQLPVLKGINQFGGLIMGFIISNIFIFVFMAIILLLNPMGLDFGLKEVILTSNIGSYYYNNNLIFIIINYYL